MPKATPRACRYPGCSGVLNAAHECSTKHGAPSPGSWADRQRGTRQQRGYGKEWDALRPLILERDAGLCQVCLAAGVLTPGCNIVDHIVNKAAGGTDDPANLRTICKPCHTIKTQGEANARHKAPAPPGAGPAELAPPVVTVGWLRL